MPTELFSNSEYETAKRAGNDRWTQAAQTRATVPRAPLAQTNPQASLASLTGLIDQINQIDQAAQQKANAGRIPGGAGLEEQSSGNISRALAGELDPSVLQQLGQRSAERGAMSGSPMGPGSNADYLRALGLTSLDLMNTGQNWLTAADARNPSAPIYSAGNQVLTAAQQAQQLAEQQRLAQQASEFQQELAFRRSTTGGGGGYRGGGGGGGGVTETGSSGGGGGGVSPDINYGSLFKPPTVWGNTNSYSGGGGSFIGDPNNGNNLFQPANGSWFDDMLWNNASDVNSGTTGAFDYNWPDYVGGMA